MSEQPKKDQFTQFFVDMEHKWLDHWKKDGTIDKYLHKNDASENYFSFQDGPITANNPMGVHHAWGRTYKDLWQRFHNLLGDRQRFQSGFDCQGLWVEVEVEKELKLHTKKDIENLVPGDTFASIAKFVQLCKDRVHKYADIQTDQSKRLGYFMDWENSYYTMSDDNNYMIWYFLKVCHENGWIYKGHESVPWCPRCETAISQHEMLTEDYKEVVHESIFFALPIVGREKENLLVWTTTPWTLPANIAVAVDKDIEYALVKGTTGDMFWVAKDLVESVFKDGHEGIIKIGKGSELVGLKYTAPFDQLQAVQEVAKKHEDVFHTVVRTDPQIMPITTEEGTGLVHTAVSAGTEDFRLGKKLGLPMIPVIADNADYLPHMGFLAGKNAKKHPEIIFNYLKEQDEKGQNWIFEIRRYKHRYPGCWRCKSELVWKVADEWYIAMDRPSKDVSKGTLRERMVTVAKQIKWIPSFGLDRELDWLKNMHDWLISKKNRYWGLALPIYECPCGYFEVFGSREELKARAFQGWKQFEGQTPHRPYIDEVVIECSKCKNMIKRIKDVGNPWLDAGIVPYSTIKENNKGEPLYKTNKEEWKKWFPADFITESFPGQFKNWFYAMIAMSSALEDTNPFKQVLGFATLVGEDGRPMHKSWGNSIEFNEGADDIGVDVMRWMYVRQNPAENLAFGPTKAQEVRRQFYLLLWNIFKFYRMNAEVDGMEYSGEPSKNANPSVLDQWIISRLLQTESEVKSNLSTYEPKQAAVSIEEFVQDLSLWYIRRSRDRVGPSATDKTDKQSFYTTTQYIFKNLSIIISPFLPFISEEIYTTLTGGESVHLEAWPTLSSGVIDEKLISDMMVVRQIVEVGHRVRKEHQMKVRQPLASVTAQIPKTAQLLHKDFESEYKQLISDELNVKEVVLETGVGDEILVTYDLEISEELRLEGEMRDLIRKIQNMRKKLGVQMSDSVVITIEDKFRLFEEHIKSQVQASKIVYGSELKVEKEV